MAIVACPEIQYPQSLIHAILSPGYSGLLIDASGETASFVLAAPKTGNIHKIHFRTTTVSSSGTLDVRVETVDTTTGTPSGTLIGTNTNGTQTGLASNTWYSPALTADAAVTQGQIIAISIVQSTGNLSIASLSNPQQRFPYSALFASAAWTKNLTPPCLALEYDDGTTPPITGCFPYSAVTSTTFNSGSTPDERGNKITLNATMRTSGFWFWADCDTQDSEVSLYDSTGTLIERLSFDKDVQNSSTVGFYSFPWTAKHTLTAGTYRLTLRATSTTNITLIDVDVNSSGLMTAMDGGTDIIFTQCTDGGAFTDTNTKRAMIGLLIDGIDVPSGGSGGLKAINLNGGIRG